MQVVPLVAGEALPQPREPVVSEQPTQHFSPELGLGTVVNATDVVDALTVGGLLDLSPGSEPRYVGANGFETPVRAEEPVVDVVGVDRKLFDAANAAKARTHFCWGIGSLAGGYDPGPGPGPKMAILGAAEGLCCVPPWAGYMLALSPIFLSAFLYNTLCSKHKDMEFPPWAGAALVMTDKGVIGRRHFVPHSQINAISWGGFNVDRNVRIRSYDTCRCTSVPVGDPLPNSWDPLVCGLYFGLLLPWFRCICIQPKEPGLYRAAIFSKHATKLDNPYGSIELLALARSPEELRSSLRALRWPSLLRHEVLLAASRRRRRN